MKNIVLIALIALPFLVSAQLDIQRSLSNNFNAVVANPALFLNHETTIRIGSIMGNGSMNGTLSRIGIRQSNSFYLNPDLIGGYVGDQIEGNISFETATLGINFRKKNAQFGFHHAFRSETSFSISRTLLQLIAGGNESLFNRTVFLQTDILNINYHEIGFHYARQINDKISIGGRVKGLLGGTAFSASADGEIATLELDHSIAYLADIQANTSGYDIDLPNLQFGETDNSGGVGGGFGLAADIGLVVKPIPKLEISLGARDLGNISWSGNARSHSVNTDRENFNGVVINIFDENESFNIDNSIEDLKENANLRTVDSTFSTGLATTYHSHIRYRATPKLTVAVAGEIRSFRDENISSIVANLSQEVNRFIHAGAVVGLRDKEPIYGARLSLTFGLINLNLSADHIPGLFSPFETDAIHLRAGVSLNFNRIKSETGAGIGWFDNDIKFKKTPSNFL